MADRTVTYPSPDPGEPAPPGRTTHFTGMTRRPSPRVMGSNEPGYSMEGV